MKKTLLFLFSSFALFSNWQSETAAPRQLLSEYGFFEGDLKALKPAKTVLAYAVNAPLFSDYAEKARFIYLPEGTTMQMDTTLSLFLPNGAVVIKNFYYSNNQASPAQGRKILETRLLIKEEKGWKALEYVWNDAQTDAELAVAGDSKPIEWINEQGQKMALEYTMPNLNQCKGCHSSKGKMTLLGVNVRQLNKNIPLNGTSINQLEKWQQDGFLQIPDSLNMAKLPALCDYSDDNNPDLNAKSRAYLDSNCGHCHNPNGPANTSGLFLDIHTTDPNTFGVFKAPVAAGRASANLKYSIVPGKPEESILIYRMQNDDPGIRMPEIGRQLEHVEGVALLKNWIRGMK